MATGKKNTPSTTAQSVARRKEEQRKKDRRNMAIIVTAVVVVIALLAGVVAWMILGRKGEDAGAGTAPASGTLKVSQQVAKDRGFTIGAKGPGSVNQGKPNIELYYDYTCSHCVVFDKTYAQKLYDKAIAGEITFTLHPVLTQAFPLNYSGVDAVIRAYQRQPDKFWPLHQALTEEMYKALEAYRKGGQDQAKLEPVQGKAVETTKRLAKQVGLRQDLIDQINDKDANETLGAWSKEFATVIEKAGGQPGTPSFLRDGKLVGADAHTLDDIYQQLVK